MAIDRDRHVFVKARIRDRRQFLFSHIFGFALILICSSSLASAQQTHVAPTVVSTGEPSPQTTAPETLVLPEGLSLQVRTTDTFPSDEDGGGGHFIGVLVQPVVIDGWVAARAGQYIVGEVTPSDKKSTLQLRLDQLILVDGKLVRIQTAVVNVPGQTPPQTIFAFTLEKAVSISTARNKSAFVAVTPEDFTNFPLGNAAVKIPYGYDPPCCVDQHGYGAFTGDGYGYAYYYGVGYFPPPVEIRYYGWHGKRWGW
jgi:hypothetical protein